MNSADTLPIDATLKLWLDRFSSAQNASALAIPWHSFHPGSGKRKEHLVLGFLTHGNEFGTLPAAVRLLEALREKRLQPAGPVSIVLGNVAAACQNQRFLEEDLNRVFTFDQEPKSLERRRAEELRPLFDEADFFLDFHQTQTPTESAFWTFPWEGDLGSWARVIGAAPLGLTRAAGGSFSKGRCCIDEYVRSRGRPALTAEVGEKGWDEEQAERTFVASMRLIEAYDAVKLGQQQLETLARGAEAVRWFETRDIVPARSGADALRPGLGNWTEVEEGELLSAPGCPELRASHSGRVLFPKYPRPGDPPAPELYRLGVALDNPDSLGASQ